MHENLQTTISLNPNQNKSKKGKPEQNNQWQTLGGGVRYGTFFLIYGNFRDNRRGKKEGIFVPTHCDLYIQNYHGDVTIGFDKSKEITFELMYHPLMKEFVYTMSINLKALCGETFVLDKEIIMKTKTIEDFNVKVNDVNLKSKESLVDSLQGIQNNTCIVLDIKFDDLKGVKIQYEDGSSSSVFDDGNANSPFIDGHRFYREGSNLLVRKFDFHSKFKVKEETGLTSDQLRRAYNPKDEDYKENPELINESIGNFGFNKDFAGTLLEKENEIKEFYFFKSGIKFDPRRTGYYQGIPKVNNIIVDLGCNPSVIRVLL
ncbi:hypothetical protein [Tenacibaculum sp. M341]|uniref:hypothetical protein n=1 Tax=Tenacibaculum sp. M341 TaxID=2530339 RepID=UPI00104BD16B|nr:hypothetical protein [Tenacibaculum sp. M341]TCI94921.1 hypothetical protein EYW44_00955 [Tenacibaculum sp. M341]